MAKFYGNVNNDAKTNLVFDRTYTNKKSMDTNANTDGVAIGRFVLVKYDRDELESVSSTLDPTQCITLKSKTLVDGSTDSYSVEKEEGEADKDIVVGSILAIGGDYFIVDAINYRTLTYKIHKMTNTEKTYALNYMIDNKDSDDKQSYDATIWQKIWSGNGVKYVKIANLNCETQSVSYDPEAPSLLPKGIHESPLSNDREKKFHVPANWGIRMAPIKGAAGVVSNSQYEKSDLNSQYGSTSYESAIYWNKEGFDSNKRSYDERTNDDITIAGSGYSGAVYTNCKTNEDESQADILEVAVQLPSLGNAVSEMWDLVYGRDRDKTIDWNEKKAGHRLIKERPDGNGWEQEPEEMETFAGTINTMHDLMGRIIITLEEDTYFTNLQAADELDYSKAMEEYFRKYADENHIYYSRTLGAYFRAAVGTTIVPLEKESDNEICHQLRLVSENDPDTIYEVSDEGYINVSGQSYPVNKNLNDGKYYVFISETNPNEYAAPGTVIKKRVIPRLVQCTARDEYNEAEEYYIAIAEFENIDGDGKKILATSRADGDFTYYLKAELINQASWNEGKYWKSIGNKTIWVNENLDRYVYLEDLGGLTPVSPFNELGNYTRPSPEVTEYPSEDYQYFYQHGDDYLLETSSSALKGRNYYRKIMERNEGETDDSWIAKAIAPDAFDIDFLNTPSLYEKSGANYIKVDTSSKNNFKDDTKYYFIDNTKLTHLTMNDLVYVAGAYYYKKLENANLTPYQTLGEHITLSEAIGRGLDDGYVYYRRKLVTNPSVGENYYEIVGNGSFLVYSPIVATEEAISSKKLYGELVAIAEDEVLFTDANNNNAFYKEDETYYTTYKKSTNKYISYEELLALITDHDDIVDITLYRSTELSVASSDNRFGITGDGDLSVSTGQPSFIDPKSISITKFDNGITASGKYYYLSLDAKGLASYKTGKVNGAELGRLYFTWSTQAKTKDPAPFTTDLENEFLSKSLGQIVEYESDKVYVPNKYWKENDRGDYVLETSAAHDKDEQYYVIDLAKDFEIAHPYLEGYYFYKTEQGQYQLDYTGWGYSLSDGTPVEDPIYYEENKYYIYEVDYSDKSILDEYYEVGQEWDKTVYPVPNAITLGRASYNPRPEEMIGFGKDLNTVNGLILKLNQLLSVGNSTTRDTTTIQGCINKINDIIRQLGGNLDFSNFITKEDWLEIDGQSGNDSESTGNILTKAKLSENKRKLTLTSSNLVDMPFGMSKVGGSYINYGDITLRSILDETGIWELLKENKKVGEEIVMPDGAKNRLVKFDNDGKLTYTNDFYYTKSQKDDSDVLVVFGDAQLYKPTLKINGDLEITGKILSGSLPSVIFGEDKELQNINYNASKEVVVEICKKAGYFDEEDGKLYEDDTKAKEITGDFVGQIAIMV